MAMNINETVKKCNICGQWVITEYKPNYPILNDSYFRHPKENFICQECAKKREEKNTFLRGEIDDRFNRKKRVRKDTGRIFERFENSKVSGVHMGERKPFKPYRNSISKHIEFL